MDDTRSALFFRTPDEFREWLEEHHETDAELWVGFHRKNSGRPSMTWPESVEEALCFGWIDGVRKRVDAESYVIRFTPRKPGSIWSRANLAKAEELIRTGRMRPAGQRTFDARDPGKVERYSFEQREVPRFDDRAEAAFRANEAAWKFFESQPPGYRRGATWWVISAKREATRARRLATLIADSEAGRRIAVLRRTGREGE